MRALALASIGCILGGIGLIALTQGKMWGQGGLLIIGGSLILFIRLGYITLVSQAWFPYACGVIALLVLVAIVWGLYRLWIKIRLDHMKAASIQDFRDESEIKGAKSWEELEGHLKYRMGDRDSFWGKQQTKELKTQDLITRVKPKKDPTLTKV